MILEPKQTTVAYRCPSCGAGVMSAVNIFSLSADMVKLKCTCGESEMTIVKSNDGKVRLSVPCIICPKPHNFTLNASLFFEKDLFVLSCPYSDINICMIGETNRVKAELARTELELLELLEETGIDSFAALHSTGDEKENNEALSDPQIHHVIMFVIGELDAEGKIYCKCPKEEKTSDEKRSDEDDREVEKKYDVEVLDDGIKVVCPRCGASRIIPIDSYLTAHAFLNADSLHLE